MDTPLTSEEKLLKLIRKKDGVVTDQPSGPASIKKENKKVEVDVLNVSNRLLIVIFLGVLICVAVRYVQLTKEQPVIPTNVPEAAIASSNQPSAAAEQTPVDVYQQVVAGRDIFQLPWEKDMSIQPTDPNALSDLSQQIKVIGILLDEDPKAIVEETATQTTFFMSKGDHIGNAVVDSIQEDKVTFTYNNKKVELTP